MSTERYNAYIAAPIVGISIEQGEQIEKVAAAIESAPCLGGRAYLPWTLKIPNAWNMPMSQWARCVFTQDVLMLDQCDYVIVCDYGRNMTSGTAWEAGYAFAKGKKVIDVIMPGTTEASLMVYNGCTVAVDYEDFIVNRWALPDYENACDEIVQN